MIHSLWFGSEGLMRMSSVTAESGVFTKGHSQLFQWLFLSQSSPLPSLRKR